MTQDLQEYSSKSKLLNKVNHNSNAPSILSSIVREETAEPINAIGDKSRVTSVSMTLCHYLNLYIIISSQD